MGKARQSKVSKARAEFTSKLIRAERLQAALRAARATVDHRVHETQVKLDEANRSRSQLAENCQHWRQTCEGLQDTLAQRDASLESLWDSNSERGKTIKLLGDELNSLRKRKATLVRDLQNVNESKRQHIKRAQFFKAFAIGQLLGWAAVGATATYLKYPSIMQLLVDILP